MKLNIISIVFLVFLSTSAQGAVTTTTVTSEDSTSQPYRETIIIREFKDNINHDNDDLYHRRSHKDNRQRDNTLIGTAAVVGGTAWGINEYRHRRRHRHWD